MITVYMIPQYITVERGWGTRKDDKENAYIIRKYISKKDIEGTLNYSDALEEAGRLFKKYRPELENHRDDDVGYLSFEVFFDIEEEQVVRVEEGVEIPVDMKELIPYPGRRFRLKKVPDFSKEKDPSEVWE